MSEISSGGFSKPGSMLKSLKTLIVKTEGGFSWTKFFYWVTAVCGVITLLPEELTKLGLTVPHCIQVLAAITGIISFVIAGLRNRNASSNSRLTMTQTNTENPKTSD